MDGSKTNQRKHRHIPGESTWMELHMEESRWNRYVSPALEIVSQAFWALVPVAIYAVAILEAFRVAVSS